MHNPIDGMELEDFINKLNNTYNTYKADYENILISLDVYSGYDGDIEGTMDIVGTKKETDEEYYKRIEQEEKLKEKAKEYDIQTIRRLAEKYGLRIDV